MNICTSTLDQLGYVAILLEFLSYVMVVIGNLFSFGCQPLPHDLISVKYFC